VPTIMVSSFILRQYPPEIPSALHPNPAGTSLSQHNDEMSNTASPSVRLQSDALPDCNGCNHNEPKSPDRLESYVPKNVFATPYLAVISRNSALDSSRQRIGCRWYVTTVKNMYFPPVPFDNSAFHVTRIHNILSAVLVGLAHPTWLVSIRNPCSPHCRSTFQVRPIVRRSKMLLLRRQTGLRRQGGILVFRINTT
jgi:hypothetical protein